MPNNNRRKQQQPNSSTEMENFQIRTLQKKRTTNFREDETKLLISLWGSPIIQNKLYLTHRKAPVMRLLAANMQQRGFYRSPDEIKTRIRNLKCLYHRIKRTMVTGSGIGTVDPDWPHFKAMDAILGKEGAGLKQETKVEDTDMLEGPRCEDIKQEIDLDINDDMESWAGNDSVGESDYEEHHIPATSISKSSPLQIYSQNAQTSIAPLQQSQHLSTSVLPNITIPTSQASLSTLRPNGGMSSTIPLPLLILNHGIQQPQDNRKNENKTGGDLSAENGSVAPDLNNILRELLTIQRQQLELDTQKFEFEKQVEKQKFELEKQRLEFDRVVGTQMMTLIPMVGGLLQRLVYPAAMAQQAQQSHNLTPSSDSSINETSEADPKPYHDDDKPVSDFDILKDSKILRTVLERGIKKYMMSDETRDSNNRDDEDSVNDDSGINDSNNLLIDDNSV